MMYRTIALILSLVAVAPGWMSDTDAHAQGWGNSFSSNEARNARQSGDIKPLREVIRALERDYGGSYLNAELFSRNGGGAEYRIDWLTEDGRKLRLVVDAQTGRVISSAGG